MKFVQVKRKFDELEDWEKGRVVDGLLHVTSKLQLHLNDHTQAQIGWLGATHNQCEDYTRLVRVSVNCRRYIEGHTSLAVSTNINRMRLVRCPARGKTRRLVVAGTELRRMFD